MKIIKPTRRAFLTTGAGLIASPAIVRAQNIIGGGVWGDVKVASGASFSLTFQASAVQSNTGSTTLNFGTLTYGSGNTRVIVSIGWAEGAPGTGNITAVTVGGNSLTQISGASSTNGNPNGARSDVWISSAPLSGSSGTVIVTQAATGVFQMAVALYNLVTTTPTPSAVRIAGGISVNTISSTSMTIPSGGGGIQIVTLQNGINPITSMPNTATDANLGSNSQLTFAHYTATGSVTPSVTMTSNDGVVLSAVAWGP